MGEDEALQKVRSLLEAGMTFFLDLTEDGELEPYAPLLQGAASVRGRSVRHQRMPIPNMTTPTPGKMIRILDTIDAALAADHTVYLHCQRGVGRTGTVIGCYLVRHGISGDDALQRIAFFREGTPCNARPSPFRERQQQRVLSWSPGR